MQVFMLSMFLQHHPYLFQKYSNLANIENLCSVVREGKLGTAANILWKVFKKSLDLDPRDRLKPEDRKLNKGKSLDSVIPPCETFINATYNDN